jgi:hypothetical protein
MISVRNWSRIEGTAEGCWLWTGALTADGYGRVRVSRSRLMLTHRLFFLALVGPIPGDLQLDHICRVRHCVNPAHLEVVTLQENVRRGMAGARQRARTHCPSGHPYSGSNLRIGPYGRACRTCNNAAARRYRDRKRVMA